MSLKLCPDYDTRFVRDRPLWLFVGLLVIDAIATTYKDVERYGWGLSWLHSNLYLETTYLGHTFYVLVMVLGLNLLLFLFSWYWPYLVTRPWKLAWQVTSLVLLYGLLMLAYEWVMFFSWWLTSSPELIRLQRIRIAIFVVDSLASVIIFLWWWRRRSMYGIRCWLDKKATKPVEA